MATQAELERRARIRLALGRGGQKSLKRLGVPEGQSLRQAQSYYKDVGTGPGVTPPGVKPDPAPRGYRIPRGQAKKQELLDQRKRLRDSQPEKIKRHLLGPSPDPYRVPKKPKKPKNIPGTVTPGHYTL